MGQQILFVLGSRTCVPEDPLIAARALGLRSLVFTPHPPGCGTAADLLDRVEYVDVREPEQAIRLAKEAHSRSPIQGVLGYEEDATLVAAHVAAALGLPAHPVSAAESAMDKPTMKERFQAAGVACARYTVAADEDDAVKWASSVGYPVVVKPCRGGASQGVIRADDEASLRQAYRRLRRIIRDYQLDNGDRPASAQLVEQYLPGDEVSVELLLQHGSAEVVTEFGKPFPLIGPYFEETVYITPPSFDPVIRTELHQLAAAAAQALGFYHGPAHCEIRLTPDGPKVLEIAGRLLGGACARSFRDRLGGDIHSYLLRAAAGEYVAIPPPPEPAPVVGALMMPVPAEGRVVAVRGVDRAKRVPGVRDVTMMAAPGDVIVPFPEQSCYAVGFISASGESESDVVDSLSWAGSSISLELAPVQQDRWTRPLRPDDGNYQAKVEVLPEHLREQIAQELADIAYDEIPAPERVRAASEVVEEQLRRPGRPCWIRVNGLGVLLGRVDGQTGHIESGGTVPESRTPANHQHLLRALLSEFARRGATNCVVHADPRLPWLTTTLTAVGFTREPIPPPDPARVRSVACSLTPSAAGPALDCIGEGDSGDDQRCCTC